MSACEACRSGVEEGEACTTPGCSGDWRYAAPGRGHAEGCRYPLPAQTPASALSEDEREALRQSVGDLPPDDGEPWLFAAVERILAARLATRATKGGEE